TQLSPTGSSLVYSTYFGGSYIDCGVGIAVDASGNAYITGYTSSTDIPTTAGAFQTTPGGGTTYGFDAFVAKIARGIALLQQAVNSGTNLTSLTVTLPQTPQSGDLLIVTNVSNNNQVNVSGGGVSSWNYIWSQVRENTVIVYGTVGSSPSRTLTMSLIGTPSPGDITSIVSEWAGLSGTLDGFEVATGPVSPIRTPAMAAANTTDHIISVGVD